MCYLYDVFKRYFSDIYELPINNNDKTNPHCKAHVATEYGSKGLYQVVGENSKALL